MCIPFSTSESNYNDRPWSLEIYETDLNKIIRILYSMPAKVSRKKKVAEVAPMNETEPTDDAKPRGRKPRGGKIVSKQNLQSSQSAPVSNIILHLKCSLNDLNEYNTRLSKLMTNPLEYNPEIPPEVTTYETLTQPFSTFDTDVLEYATPTQSETWLQTKDPICKVCTCENVVVETTDNVNTKEMNAKLKLLKIQLYKNSLQSDKKAACFWCTYDFDNAPCYIPKYEMDGTIYGYGSFCRPECAVAYLMKENIDDSTKFERYHLLNQIYSKVYNCKKNIKPAPNPYYLLDKFYGNLSIQEYRKLLKTEHLLLVIDKPLTRILPELHEDTDDLLMNIYGLNKANTNTSGVYKVKRQSEKPNGPTKTSIIRNKFGLA
jgi:hypothetical protein